MEIRGQMTGGFAVQGPWVSLAVELGYASDSAFSSAFKREVGESPLRYRYRVREGSVPA